QARVVVPEQAPGELWTPVGIQAHAEAATMPRRIATLSTSALTSGTLQLCGGVVLLPGYSYTKVSFVTGGTALAAGTNQWFTVVRLDDLAVLGKTADDGATAWGTFTIKTLTLASPIAVRTPRVRRPSRRSRRSGNLSSTPSPRTTSRPLEPPIRRRSTLAGER